MPFVLSLNVSPQPLNLFLVCHHFQASISDDINVLGVLKAESGQRPKRQE